MHQRRAPTATPDGLEISDTNVGELKRNDLVIDVDGRSVRDFGDLSERFPARSVLLDESPEQSPHEVHRLARVLDPVRGSGYRPMRSQSGRVFRRIRRRDRRRPSCLRAHLQ